MIKPRDFIETKEGLLFAAVNGNAALLRYYPSQDGSRVRDKKKYRKVSGTKESFKFLEKQYPEYILEKRGYRIQTCPDEKILKVHEPSQKLKDLEDSENSLVRKCLKLNSILEDIPMKNKGITGSLLVDLALPSSDIDFVVYGKKHFEEARILLKDSSDVRQLSQMEWKQYYDKRFKGSGSLDFPTFLWHEKRKQNIGMIDGTLFNLLMVGKKINLPDSKLISKVKFRCFVRNADESFNIPSLYNVEHPLVDRLLSFTHTYAGQAVEGEEVEVSGNLEKLSDNRYQVVVGSTREAENEYIKVLHRNT